ncbi:unnamed protein product [Hermetia illucens]|uniref:B box-type domain-containing protein n=1 Tax=Hermetia illucens TaxID=343691 RepID=A0A7R8YQ84_HERIL|nr:unnamed protein product [Hermetia illucens]
MIAVQGTNWIGSEISDMNSHTTFKSGKPLGHKDFGVVRHRLGNSDTYPTSNSSSNQGSDSPTPLRSDSRSSTGSSKKTEKSSKSAKKTIRSDSAAVSRSDAVEKLKTLICLICKYCTEMPLGGIIQLPQNYILVRKIENYFVSVRENGIASMWCNLCCDAVTATHHCMTCSINLCGFCKEAHERQRSTAHHNISSMLELQKSKEMNKGYSNSLKPNLKCSMHPGFEMKLFCLTCQQIICSDCNILLHKGHKVDTVRKVIKTYQKLLKESTDKAKPICEYANHSISKLATISKKINEKCDQVQQEVELHMAAYFEALEVHRNTLLQQIARARETKMQMILEQQFDLEKRSSHAKAVVEFSEELISIGSDAEILSFVNVLLKRFDFCYKYKPLLDSKISDTLHFLPEVRAPSTKAQNNIPMYGIITTQTVEPSYCTLETEGYDQLRVHRKAELVILSRDNDGMPLCHGGLTITAILKYKDSSARPLPFQISDRRDGSYVISFTPDSTGTLVLSVTIKNKHIKGSPFTLRAKSLRPHTGIFHCCAFCSSKGSKAATCACDGIMQGFKGCGHGHAGHPGRRHWSCCASVLENSECTTANKLLN